MGHTTRLGSGGLSLLMTNRQRIRRRQQGLRRRREAWLRLPLHVEALESREMLNSDPFLLFTAGAATDMTLRVNASNVELINRADSSILASKPLSDFGGAGANCVGIGGPGEEDRFIVGGG